jgi:hypothetical protein
VGTPTYRALRDSALDFDAYYKDEWGVVNDASNCALDASERSPWHKNVFTTVTTGGSTPVETADTFEVVFQNRADPNTNAALQNKANPVPPAGRRDFVMKIYCSDSVTTYAKSLTPGQPWTVPINLTLYYGVGFEINRHGIRSFFKPQPNMQAFIQVSGIERPQFGVTPDEAQIKKALADHFKVDPVPYRMKVLAAFSTGSCGLNQVLLNDLVDMTTVERLVFYDCLYAQQCGNTADAIRRLKGKASSKLKIVVYKASECANSFKERTDPCPDTAKTRCPSFSQGKCLDFNRMSVVVDNPGLIDPNGVIGNLFQNTSYIALVIFRALQGAVADGVVAIPSGSQTAWNDMAALLVSSPRGLTISNKACFNYVHGNVPTGAPYTSFEDWSATNKKVINAFYAKVGTVATKDSFRNLLWGNMLPGWGGGDGEDKHDLLIPEFGWEYLPY